MCPGVWITRAGPGHRVAFSEPVERAKREIKAFLMEHFYRHPRVLDRTRQAERVIEELFLVLLRRPELLPAGVRGRFSNEGEQRAVADYVAGMTDRYAVAAHRRLVHPSGSFDLLNRAGIVSGLR